MNIRERRASIGVHSGKNGVAKGYRRVGRLLTTGEVAQLLGIHVNTVRRWDNTGTLKSYRLGPRADRRFSRSEAMRLLHRVKNMR